MQVLKLLENRTFKLYSIIVFGIIIAVSICFTMVKYFEAYESMELYDEAVAECNDYKSRCFDVLYICTQRTGMNTESYVLNLTNATNPFQQFCDLDNFSKAQPKRLIDILME